MDREITGASKKQKFLRLIYISLSVILILLLLRFYVKSTLRNAHVKRNNIDIATVRQGDLEGSFTTDGTVTPVTVYQVEASVGGKIERILHNAGDRVKTGDALLELSNDDLQLSLIAQETAVTEQVNNLNNARILNNQNRLLNKRLIAEARNNLKKTERDFVTKQSLHQKGYLTDEEYAAISEDKNLAETRFECLVEEASTDSLFREQQIMQLGQAVTQIKRSLEQVRSRINDLKIKAPIDGVITEMELTAGQMISIGTKIAVIEDSSSYYVQAKVDQYYLSQLRQGCQARVNSNGQSTWLKVAKIHPKLSNDNVLVDLTGHLPKEVRSGQSVTVDIISSTIKNTLILPQGQYLIDTASRWVYVINQDGRKAVRRDVTFGYRNMREIEIKAGLKAGEQVIVSSYKDWLKKKAVLIKGAK